MCQHVEKTRVPVSEFRRPMVMPTDRQCQDISYKRAIEYNDCTVLRSGQPAVDLNFITFNSENNRRQHYTIYSCELLVTEHYEL